MDVAAGEFGLHGVSVRTVLVPLDPPIQTSSAEVPEAPLVLLDLRTDQGITGRSYVFCYTPLVLAPLARLVHDMCRSLVGVPLTPTSVRTTLEARFRLLRPQGLVTMAAAAVDIAVWDILALAAGRPLVSLLGGRPAPVAAYASLRCMQPAAAAREAEQHAALGFTRFKVKVGLGEVAADLQAVRAPATSSSRASRGGKARSATASRRCGTAVSCVPMPTRPDWRRPPWPRCRAGCC